jgi:hypothetical protein
VKRAVRLIFLSASGLSKEKVDDLAKLINGILTRQLDPKKVYGELDQIYATVNDLKATLHSTPLASASPEERKKLAIGQGMVNDCNSFGANWNLAIAHVAFESSGYRPTTRPPTLEEVLLTNKKYQAMYATLYPQLMKLRASIAAVFPNLTSKEDWRTVADPDQLRAVCKSVNALGTRYIEYLAARYGTKNTAQPMDMGCYSLADSWVAAQKQPHEALNPLDTLDQLDAAKKSHAAEYKRTLGPRLAMWRDAMVKEIPNMPVKDYGEVSDPSQLASVCLDVSRIASAYRNKIAEDLANSARRAPQKR